MRKLVRSTVSALAFAALPTLAWSVDGGTAAGAATGAAPGAAAGGPVGAAVGAGVGGAAGHAASRSSRTGTMVETRRTRTVGCTTKTKQKTNAVGQTTTKKTVC